MRRRELRSDMLLLLAAMVWGAGFIAQKAGMDSVGPLLFTALRLLAGALVLLPIIILKPHQPQPLPTPHPTRAIPPTTILLVSLVLLLGFALQQTGIKHTTAGKAGFITALYVVFTPLIALFTGHRPPKAIWPACCIAMLGLMLLSLDLSGPLELQPGDGLVLLGAIVWAVHVVMLARVAPRSDPLRLAAQQFLIAGLGALALALAFESCTLQAIWAARWAIAYSAVFATALAFTIQIIAQRSAPPAHVAILLSLEAVFAAIFGALLLHERMNARELAGASLMLLGVVLSQRVSGAGGSRAPRPSASSGA